MRPFLLTCALACLLALLPAPTSSADLDYAVKLQTTEFSPAKITDAAAKSAGLVNKHALIQFTGPIDDFLRQDLAGAGIELLDYVPNYAYTARVKKGFDQKTADKYDIRWFGGIEPVNKIDPLLASVGIGEWARRGEGRAQFVVVLHRDEDAQRWSDRFQTDFQGEILGIEPSINAIDLIMPEAAYYRVADLDAVIWVKLVNPPQQMDNNITRVNTGAEYLQQAPYNLTGSGVTVAIWDGGLVDQNHPDFSGRVSIASGGQIHYHPTHVAGTIMGDGTLSAGLYRGMAPQANLASFLWWGTASQAQAEHDQARIIYGATIDNNSWGLGVGDPATQGACQAMMGNYLTENATLDNIVRGGTGDPWVSCWSAGNERGSATQYCGSIGWTWNTVGGYSTSKNIICVGAIDGTTNAMLSFSSWGPCDDGRIKPDVVAPGCIHSTYPGNTYATLCGTSMSSPATVGNVALLQQQAAISFPGQPLLSSTFKGLLINTASDLGATGPDYQYGYGKINSVPAARKIMQGDSSFIQAQLSTGQTHVYDLTVPTCSELQVTLVWDDPGATVISGPVLVNDLDLVLVDPWSNEELPWKLNPASPGASATKGADHLNNVEEVTVYNPYPGLWKARVSGYNVPQGPQKYSLIFTPDAIHTPGAVRALAVFSSGNVSVNAGQPTTAEFWAVNVGQAADSARVQISDDRGWLSRTIDTVVNLAQYDSAFFSLTATVPSGAMAWDKDSISCLMTSKSDGNVKTTGRVVVSTNAYYLVALTPPAGGVVKSPDTAQFGVKVKNLGNNTDDIKVSCTELRGWTINPDYKWVYGLAPQAESTVTFSVAVPAEEPDHATNTATVYGYSLGGGSTQQTTFGWEVSNPVPPPTLLTPDTLIYTPARVLSFTWSGAGDSYNLYIASNRSISTRERTYTGIIPTNFTMPTADSLGDGAHYWAVRKYVGADSSSLQRYSRKIVVDVTAPGMAMPTYPINGAWVGQDNFIMIFSGSGKATVAEKAPEFFRIELCQNSNFAANVRVYEPVTGGSFQVPDIIPQGRWYWRIQAKDQAGNASAMSYIATFVLDSQGPPVPTLLSPSNNGHAGGTTVTFRWSTDPPPAYEEAKEYYTIDISDDPGFYTTLLSQNVIATSVGISGNNFQVDSDYYWRVMAADSLGHQSDYQPSPFMFTYGGFTCGDVNGNGSANVSDVTYLLSYLFGIPSGPPPNPFLAGSVNCDTKVNVSDVAYLLSYLFGIPQGPAPCCL